MNLKTIMLAALCLPCAAASAQTDSINYSATVLAAASSGKFAPYMNGSWNSGRLVEDKGLMLDLRAEKPVLTDRRFSWGAGVEIAAGIQSGSEYERWQADDDAWILHNEGQAPFRVIQAYAEARFRGVFILAGMKEQNSAIVDSRLSSGDLVRSNNARPVPGCEIGFNDFQNIPFTNGWVQIEGRLMYGRMTDSKSKRERYNYYSLLLAEDLWYTYKRCYFRTKPSMPLSITVGMQAAGTFAGNTVYYTDGKFHSRSDRGFHLRDLWDMFFPNEGSGEGFYKGSSLGSWDFKARYRFADGTQLSAYFEWPWEDGSGIGRRNGWDGVWGLQYTAPRNGIIEKAVVEYLDFCNQSGPLHWAPHDRPGTTITTNDTGGDNYYNNDVYGPYANYGMSIGTPFLLSPLYNTNGCLWFMHSRTRGFHAAASGSIAPDWSYTMKVSYQKAWGSGRLPLATSLENTSAMLSASWTPSDRLKGFSAGCQLAFDAGSLRGNNFGAMLSVSYSGNFSLKK